MSLDLHLSCFDGGKLSAFPLSLLEGAFGRHAGEREPHLWKLDYGSEGSSDLSLTSAASGITGLSVNPPPRSLNFWRGILALLHSTQSCLHWAEGLIIVQPVVRAHLPPELLQSLGEPTLVLTPEDIRQTVGTL